jgi:hypothetical protein
MTVVPNRAAPKLAGRKVVSRWVRLRGALKHAALKVAGQKRARPAMVNDGDLKPVVVARRRAVQKPIVAPKVVAPKLVRRPAMANVADPKRVAVPVVLRRVVKVQVAEMAAADPRRRAMTM